MCVLPPPPLSPREKGSARLPGGGARGDRGGAGERGSAGGAAAGAGGAGRAAGGARGEQARARGAMLGTAADQAAGVVDEAALLAESSFPIKPDALVTKAKDFLGANNGCDKPELMAEDFEFAGPVVGPLSKSKFIEAFTSFELKEAFPDAQPQLHHFRVDPFEPNRVWFTTRFVGTNTGPFAGSIPPTGVRVESPPQSCSVIFNEEGLVRKFTIGYVMDRDVGNSGGLGGAYGLLYAIGKPLPFPEAQPWKISKRYKAFLFFGNLTSALKKRFGKKDA